MFSILKHEISLRSNDRPECRRLFHGRGRCYPGLEDLTIDWYQPVVLVTLYRKREPDWLRQLTALLAESLSALDAVIVQHRYLIDCPVEQLYGSIPEELFATERGLRFKIDLTGGQNFGFFPDMAMARHWVCQHGQNGKILNLFAYTCSFSVAAIAAGAGQVVNLDMSRSALQRGRENHQLNQLDERRSTFLAVELFRSFSKLRKLGPFDIIICDPPGEQGGSFRPARDWPRLAQKLPDLLNTNGILMACVSTPHLSSQGLETLFSQSVPQLELEQILLSGPDFPEREEGLGGRALIYRKS